MHFRFCKMEACQLWFTSKCVSFSASYITYSWVGGSWSFLCVSRVPPGPQGLAFGPLQMRASGLGTKRTSGAHHVAYSWICSRTCRHSRSAVGLANIPDLQSDLQALQICNRICKHSSNVYPVDMTATLLGKKLFGLRCPPFSPLFTGICFHWSF